MQNILYFLFTILLAIVSVLVPMLSGTIITLIYTITVILYVGIVVGGVLSPKQLNFKLALATGAGEIVILTS